MSMFWLVTYCSTILEHSFTVKMGDDVLESFLH